MRVAPSAGSCITRERMVTQRASSTATVILFRFCLLSGSQQTEAYTSTLRFCIHSSGDSLQIVFCQVLNRGLHLDFDVLQWSKLVEILGQP